MASGAWVAAYLRPELLHHRYFLSLYGGPHVHAHMYESLLLRCCATYIELGSRVSHSCACFAMCGEKEVSNAVRLQVGGIFFSIQRIVQQVCSVTPCLLSVADAVQRFLKRAACGQPDPDQICLRMGACVQIRLHDSIQACSLCTVKCWKAACMQARAGMVRCSVLNSSMCAGSSRTALGCLQSATSARPRTR